MDNLEWTGEVIKNNAEVRKAFIEFLKHSIDVSAELDRFNIESFFSWKDSLADLRQLLWDNHVV